MPANERTQAVYQILIDPRFTPRPTSKLEVISRNLESYGHGDIAEALHRMAAEVGEEKVLEYTADIYTPEDFREFIAEFWTGMEYAEANRIPSAADMVARLDEEMDDEVCAIEDHYYDEMINNEIADAEEKAWNEWVNEEVE